MCDTKVYNEFIAMLNPKLGLHDIIRLATNFVERFPNMSTTEKQDAIVGLLREVAKGPDRVAGTADDIIQPQVIDSLKVALDNLGSLNLIIESVRKRKMFKPLLATVLAVVVCKFAFNLGGNKRMKPLEISVGHP